MTAPGTLVLTATVLMLATLPCSAVDVNAWSSPLEDATPPQDVTVHFGETADVSLPAMPARAGKVAVLRFGAMGFSAGPAGCNLNVSVSLNGGALGRRTASGSERLIGRPVSFRFTGKDGTDYPVFSGPRLMIMFAPDTATANTMTECGLGGAFLMDVSDLVSGVDGNTLSFTNNRPTKGADGTANVIIERLEAGWLDRTVIPQPDIAVPERGSSAATVTCAGLTLSQGTAGGFSVAAEGGPELLVETAIGMGRETPSALLAQDGMTEGVALTCRPWAERGFRMTATFPSFELTRTVRVNDGLIEWVENWTNTTGEVAGLPFRHRLFLRGEAANFVLSGDTDASALAGSAPNPTVFAASRRIAGAGMGVTAESDWLRLLMYTRIQPGFGEVYSECLALPPRTSIRFELTITPVSGGNGYWSFINSVRSRWGVNGTTMQRPMFWGYSRAQGDSPEDVLRTSLGHLGPIYVATFGWMRLTTDASLARGGAHPRIPEGATPTPGQSPDLDLAAFLRFEHRDAWWEGVAGESNLIRRVCPNVKVINKTHPAMEVVYQPLAGRFPIAGEAIRTADGTPFHMHHYDKAHLGTAVARDWAVYYYSPRPGSRYLQSLVADCRRSMDNAGSDGVYCDEFSWAGRRRSYSRYDYSRWDGHSVDLDADGAVLRRKSDNAYTSESCQLQMTHESLIRDKFFLGNGGSALRSLNSRPIHRFIEGGNGHGTMADGHLSAVPLVLGNFGDRSTREGVFAAVRQCLANGCVYSPMAVNQLLEGPDNFVCKQYPVTVRELGPGWVVGEERLITSVTRSFDWPGKTARVRQFCYDSTGALVSSDEIMDTVVGGAFEAAVSEGGLIIAELVP